MKITPVSGFFSVILSAAVVAALFALQSQPRAGDEPVVLELFTSQGCSSCPSADELLRKLARDPDYRDRIIPLAYHVDYWNHLGWRDPFSSRQWSERQGEYVRAMKLESAYTPQMVINGARQMVGSSAFQIYRAIEEESKRKPDARVSLLIANGEAIVRAESKRSAELIVVAFENGAVTKVERGENRGRTIANDAIVRKFVRAGMVNGTVEKRVALALAPNMGAVAFLQDPKTHRIFAATTTR
jgi:hypothetical protein